MLPWLNTDTPFPALRHAMREPNGLLAAGADLSPQRILHAYRTGIFPWFNAGEPILWWSPDPRMVLVPGEFKLSRSLQKFMRKNEFEVRFDTQFEPVMRACAAPRAGQSGTWIHEDMIRRSDAEGFGAEQSGTWIHEDMIRAYRSLHDAGDAHSVEVWQQGMLVGGLYGIALGRMFYGESMFSAIPNGSKIALACLARQLHRWNFGLIDCQMHTAHLASLGAREIPRDEFIAKLKDLVNCAPISHWRFDPDTFP